MTKLSKEEKQQRIVELREALTSLEAELAKDIEREQHAAIDQLDAQFMLVEDKFHNLKTFWQTLKEEWSDQSRGRS
jgi:predicted nuclease with TOPRIM domain